MKLVHIKKDTTVALFKMEDEYLKDIRRNAGSDGTKVKGRGDRILRSKRRNISQSFNVISTAVEKSIRFNDTDFIYKIYDEENNLMDVSQVSEIGSYRIVASFNAGPNEIFFFSAIF